MANKDDVFRALFLIVQWDYESDPLPNGRPIVYPYKGKDIQKYVDDLLKKARKFLVDENAVTRSGEVKSGDDAGSMTSSGDAGDDGHG